MILVAEPDRWACDRRLWGRDVAASPSRERLRDAVRAAIATALTDKQREVVEAYFYEGLSQGEIARKLGVTQQVVQKRLFGAPRGGRRIGGAMLRLRGAIEPLLPTPAAPTANAR